jgi:hypothetical protein
MSRQEVIKANEMVSLYGMEYAIDYYKTQYNLLKNKPGKISLEELNLISLYLSIRGYLIKKKFKK